MSPPRCDKSGRAWGYALPRAGEHWEAGEASLPAPLFAFTSLSVNEVLRYASAPFVRSWFLALQPVDSSCGAAPAVAAFA